MSDTIRVKVPAIKVIRDDITTLDIDCFVFYARPHLKLGSGFGTAISVRGGPSIQAELNSKGTLNVTEVVTTAAGNLKAKAIIHAVGPAFQEDLLEEKLRRTIQNVLQEADRKGVKRLAFPAMGTGFYGVPLDLCAQIMIETIAEYLRKSKTGIEDVTICVLDNRELKPFRKRLGQIVNA